MMNRLFILFAFLELFSIISCKPDSYELTTTVYEIDSVLLSSIDYSGTEMIFTNKVSDSSLVLLLDFNYSAVNETVRYLDTDPQKETSQSGQFPYEIEQRIEDINLYANANTTTDSIYTLIGTDLYDVDNEFIAQDEFRALAHLNSIMFGEEMDLLKSKGKMTLNLPFEPHLLIYPNHIFKTKPQEGVIFKVELILSSINGPYELDTLTNYCHVELP